MEARATEEVSSRAGVAPTSRHSSPELCGEEARARNMGASREFPPAQPWRAMFQRKRATRGVALVMTLITLSILIILLLGFLSTMTIERRAAGAYEDTQRAKLVAQGAVSHAIDLLRTNIPEPARLSESPLT